jgi:hypothetical protein
MRTLLLRFTLPGLFLFLLTASNLQSQAFTEETLIKLTAAGYSSSAWGDYDNDGDLDVVIAGDNATKIYEHIYQTDYDTNFTELATVTLPTVYDGSVAWGDFDNDGYIDLLVSGSGATTVYRNNGGTTFDEQPGIVLPDAYEGYAEWGDLDNDGFLDIVSTGDDGYGNQFTRIFLNNHDNTFSELTDISIIGIKGSVSLGDYDNDKDLDILISGYNSYWGYLSRVYRNDNGTFTDIGADLPPVGNGSVAWGDYDNDGDLDILISGYGWSDGRITRVYRNDAGIFTDISAGLTGVEYGTAAWGDYDNDGDLDILLTGEDASYVYITKVYRNDAGSFTDISESLTGIYHGSGVWGDYDKDGDLDIILTGNSTSGNESKVYKNNSVTANTVPAAPTGLVATPVGNKVTLSWNKSTDTETDQNGLSYNVYVGTLPGIINKRSPMSSMSGGFRRIAQKGVIQSNSWQINRLPAGTYYWSVQATDNALAGSPFASEGNFTVAFSNSIAPIAEQVVLPEQNFATLTVTESTTPTSREWKYSTVSGGPYDQSISGATGTTCASSFPSEGIYYVVCISVYGGVSYTSNQVKIAVTNFIEQTDINLTGVYRSSASWGDYDNDGNMDLLLTGYSSSGRVSKIFRNEGSNTFAEQTISLTPVRYSSSEWGDYDADGDLDILLTGDSDVDDVSKIYRNNGDNTFTEQTSITLQGVCYSSVAWGDYDNDGDLDILLTGDTGSDDVSIIYRNDAGVFTDIDAGLTGARLGSAHWGDYDNDGDLDILLAGYNSSIYGFSRIYRNNNGAFTAIDPGFLDNPDASVAWGDYDNDGDLDVLWSVIYQLKIYNNDGGIFSNIGFNQPDFYSGEVAWGDYDNDGDLDFLVAGIDREGLSFNKIFRNDNNVFTETFIYLPKVTDGSIDWVDYDNDGDLDIMLTGNSDSGPISKIYKNSITSSNTVPATPAGLSSANNGNTVTLSWNKTTDTQTPQDGLSYNLYIGTASGIVNKKPPMSALPGGDRRIVQRGPVQGNTWPAKRFLAGTYYWSVQAIDNNFAGSAFATEGTFIIPFSNSIAPEATQVLQLNQDGTLLTVTESSAPDSRQWMYSTVSGGPYDQAIAGATGTTYMPNFGEFGTYYVVCISVKDAVSYISNEVKIIVPAFTEQTGISIEGVYRSGVDWGDFDNDGDLDILITGYSATTYMPMSEIFMNDGGFEFDNYAVLTGLYYSSAAWGDYDNDGDLDVLITGYDGGSDYLSIIYNNDAGVFTDIGAGLTGVYTGSGDWADYDNDGDLDVLITGQSNSEGDISKIYRNDAGIFTDIDAGLYGVGNSSAAWGDYDGDGDHDIALSGSGTSKIYSNNNGNFTDINAGLDGQYSSSIAWGDYDSDGDLDLFLGGQNSSKIYNNDAGVFTDIGAGLPIIQIGSVKWGDFDNDGDLDILMTGENPSIGPITKIFRNDDGFFTDINEIIEGVTNSDAAWGDYDNDGDLDILLTGSGSGGRISKIYSNNMPTPNNVPAAPSNIQATPGSNIVTFSWDKAADTETAQDGLSYNLYVGTTTGSADWLSPMADVLTGYRRIVQRGIQTNSWTIKRLPAGSYYWSVQTIDNNFAGSAFATEDIFSVVFSNSIAPTADQNLQLNEDGDMLTVTESSTPTSRQWMYSIVSGGPYDQAIAGATAQTYTPNFSDFGTYYVVCVSVKDDVLYTTNEVKINVLAFAEQTDIILDGVYNSSASWGDYDNDGDLDILITGSSNSGYISKIYMNDLGIFTDISAGLTPVRYGATAWGDYDNDGDLDILLTGYDGSTRISKIYNNDAGVFTDIDAGLTGVNYSSVAWGDYDNDGDLDILLAGYTGSGDISKIYRNDAGVFTDIDAGLTGIEDGDLTWGDYDNDGDLDILLTGSYHSIVYRNDNGNFTDVEAGLPGVYNSTVSLGDYDSDGDLDILLTGYSDYGDISRIYNNEAGVFTDVEAGLAGIENGSANWTDFDNDGDLDIILCGYNDIVSERITRFYLNDTGAFTDITDELKGYSMTPVNSSAMAVGDYDNDGDLDILLTGYGSSGRLSKVYTNNTSPANDVPVAPSNLQAAPGSNKVTLSWNKTTDTETPQNGLSYNLYIGTTTGSGDMKSPMADVTNGYRRIVQRGIQTNTWTINRLPATSYYWSVQAIDNNFAGSAFASEGVFTVAFSNSIAPETDQTLGLNQDGVMLTVTESSTPDSRQWMYSTVSGGPYDEAIPGATADTYTPNFSDFGTYYVVCVSTKSAVAYISNQVKISVVPFEEQTGITLEGVDVGSVSWGDYDNDGDLDILLTGYSNSGYFSEIYSNDAGIFTDVDAGLPGVERSSVAWGDYDNDGDLDILLSGYYWDAADYYITKIYRNDSGIFTDIAAGLTGVYRSSVAWGDYDNDGDLDILLSGDNGPNNVSKIYRNDSGVFTDINAVLAGVNYSSVAWGDYDNDGDLDILLTGSGYSEVYRNDNSIFTEIDAGLYGITRGSASWGDYDNDGDLDILLAGSSISGVYNNDAGVFTDISAGLQGIYDCSAAWGDFDNDGDLDILLTGYDGSAPFSKVYMNDAGAFTAIEASLTGISNGSVAWGDYDNDGDLDFLLTGYGTSGRTAKVYRNNSPVANTVPAAPANLLATPGSNIVTLNWNKSTDTETPQDGLSYNLYIGTTAGTVNRLSPMADITDGYRKIVHRGIQTNSWIIKRLPAATYYWSVQAIDNAFAGSPFATESSFTVAFSNSISPTADQTLQLSQDGTMLTVSESSAPTSRQWMYSTESGGPYDQAITGATGSTYTPNFSSFGTYYVVCVSIKDAISYTTNEVKISVPAFEEQTGIILEGADNGSVEWGDYDNDGDLDILLTGHSNSGSFSEIYRNDTGVFTDIDAGLTAVEAGSVAWGDYDNDGDLDILLTGSGLSIIYNNDAGIFTDIGAGLTGVQYGTSAAWGDYDNDGDLDILITGYKESSDISIIYRNDSGIFTDIDANLQGSQWGSAVWGDYDNDGDLDILLTGSWRSKVYRNDNGKFADINAGLYGIYDGSGSWGDYDSDGDLDILLTGNGISRIYNNDAGIFTDIEAGLTGISNSTAAWCDFDNDGDLDIISNGYGDTDWLTAFYRNDAGTFTDVTDNLAIYSTAELFNFEIAVGDYDNDGDLDGLLAGESSDGYVSRIFRNNTTPANVAPTVPSGLTATPGSNVVSFTWSKSTDTQTPQDGLSYNLYIGSTAGTADMKAPMSDITNGYRRIVRRGIQTDSCAIKMLPAGTYYWSVQSIDNNFAGSAFATEKSFTVAFSNSIAPIEDQTLQLNEDGNVLTVTEPDTPDSRQWKYSTVSGGPYDQEITGATGTAYTPNFSSFGTYYVVCVSTKDGIDYISNEVKISVPAFTEQTGIVLEGVEYSSVAWGDYDNDGDLDILLIGYSNSGYFADIYSNEAGIFTAIGAGLTGVVSCSVDWGDYDNDGDLDILLSGYYWDNGSFFNTKIYRNDAGVFTDIDAGLTDLSDGSAKWGDYDNDGDLDILSSGYDGTNYYSKIYRNDTGVFTDINAGLAGGERSSVDWGDYDNDGDLDILLTGSWNSRVYRNDNGVFSDINAGLYGIYYGSGLWGDYDNDGDLDILLTGAGISRIYNNDAGVFTDISAGLQGVYESCSSAWGDYDNDGDLDILITGNDGSDYTARIYNNDAGIFTGFDAGLTGVNRSSVAWGDYDNDGDLDILLAGLNTLDRVAKVYRNNSPAANTIPAAPANLVATPGANVVSLTWDKSTDTETAQEGLSYNLYVGSSAGSVDRKSPMADLTNGYRRIVGKGSVQTDTTSMKMLPAGTYYWSVQAVDNAFAGSAFAAEGTFTIDFSNSVSPVDDQELLIDQNGTLLTVTESSTPDSRQWKYSTVSGGPYDQEITGETGTTYTPNFQAFGAYYVVCVSVKDGVEYISNEVKINIAAFTEQTGIVLTGVRGSCSASWGDYDSDGDLDILLVGRTNTGYISTIYNNDAGVFTDIGGGTDVAYKAAWGDYDNDGDLDILYTGYESPNYISRVFRNDAGDFVDIDAGLTGVYSSAIAWGDYDNDGDLDILLAGRDDSEYYSKIYRNDAGTFTDIDAGLTPVREGFIDWGDYDNDGDKDILLAGYTGSEQIAHIYRNDDGYFSNIDAGLSGGGGWQVMWGDYDNDGDLDVLSENLIYSNNGDGTFTHQSDINLQDFGNYCSAWGDYDNDGDLDILISGYSNTGGERITCIYRNEGNNTFELLTGVTFKGTELGSVAWGDYDNDGDLDILIAGNYATTIYRNNSIVANTAPSAPTNLVAAGIDANKVTLSWNKATDTNTPQNSLTYNVRMGTVAGGSGIVGPMASGTNGYRRIPARGNADLKSDGYLVTDLTSGRYYWSVQAVDQAYAGGSWATEGQFYILEAPGASAATNITETSFTANWATSAGATGYRIDVATDSTFTNIVAGYDNMDAGDVTSTSITGLSSGTIYYYRLRAYNAGGTSILNSNTIKVSTLGVPAAPVAQDAINISQTGFTTNWNSLTNVDGYLLDVSTDDTFSSLVAGYNNLDVGNVVSYDVSGLTANTVYYYRVRAYNGYGTGDNSNTILVTTLINPPPAPTGFTAHSCNDLVTLSWSAVSDPDFSHYLIFGGETPNPTIRIDSIPNSSAVTITLTGLTHGTTYYYRMVAVNTLSMVSNYSSEVSVEVKTGVIPRIKAKWGDVLICYNIGDSLTQFSWYRGTTLITGETKQYYVTNKDPGSYHAETTDIDGCVNSSNIIDIGSKSLSVYPNPAKSNFTLDLSSKAVGETVVSLYNATGMKVLEYRTEKKETWLNCEISAGNLKDGIYMIEVIVNNEEINYTRLIIIE